MKKVMKILIAGSTALLVSNAWSSDESENSAQILQKLATLSRDIAKLKQLMGGMGNATSSAVGNLIALFNATVAHTNEVLGDLKEKCTGHVRFVYRDGTCELVPMLAIKGAKVPDPALPRDIHEAQIMIAAGKGNASSHS
ncbi:MAG: hypothetical protein LBJ92_00180 [Holosporales bacterium]|jgi:hypothetical protein|nr:hypothetical protein [Holosporales bacterium]